jgi:tight adherence protein B
VSRRGTLAAAVSALALLVCAAAATASPGVRIAGIDTAGYPHLIVNVVTAQPVTKAPRLREDGFPVSGFEAVNLGDAKSMVVAIDNSRSMKGASLTNAAEAARTFIDAKNRGDGVSVIAFGRHTLQLTGFSTSSAQADGALQGLAVDRKQGTALYDAVVAAARVLRTSEQPGRVIVLLTDGRDVSSLASLEAAVAAARKADAAVYPIGIESSDFDPVALKTIAADTGGTYHAAGSSAELERVYASIASELARTWRLGYDTAARPGDRITLHVAVPGAGAATRSVDVPATFPGGDAPQPSAALPSVAYTLIGTIVISLLVGLLVIGALFTLVRLRRGSWVRQRLAPHVTNTKNLGNGHGDRLSFLKALFTATEGAFGRRSQWRSVERLLVRGDVPPRPAEFLWLMLGAAVVGGVVFAAAGAPVILVLLAMVGGGAVPYGFVGFRVRRRSKAFEDQLPDLLTTIAASLKAGHSFKHGLQAVVDEAAPPASIELKRVLTEAGLGRPLDDALADMAERVGSENFAFAITAVTIQRQVGGSLATLFDMVSETVRNRQQFARKIRSLTAMGRMSAYTLVGVPFFIAGMVSLMNPGYMQPLFHTQVGHYLLFGGLAMILVGSSILKKIVSFKG